MPAHFESGLIPASWLKVWFSAGASASEDDDVQWARDMIVAMYPLIAAHATQDLRKRVIGLAREYATYDDLLVVEHPNEVSRQILATVDADASAV